MYLLMTHNMGRIPQGMEQHLLTFLLLFTPGPAAPDLPKIPAPILNCTGPRSRTRLSKKQKPMLLGPPHKVEFRKGIYPILDNPVKLRHGKIDEV